MFYHAYLLNKDSAANKHRIAYLHYIQIGVNLQDGIMNLQKYSENKNKLVPSLLLQRRQQFFSYIVEKWYLPDYSLLLLPACGSGGVNFCWE